MTTTEPMEYEELINRVHYNGQLVFDSTMKFNRYEKLKSQHQEEIAKLYDDYVESEHSNCSDDCTKKWYETENKMNFVREIIEIFSK